MMLQLFRVLKGWPWWAYIPIAVALCVLYELLSQAGWYLLLASIIGWLILGLALCRQAGIVPSITSLGPLDRFLGWLADGAPAPITPVSQSPGPAATGAAPQSKVSLNARDRLAEIVRVDLVQRDLDEEIIGQELATAELARAIEVFLKKPTPLKPLSVVLVGAKGSGRTTLGRALAGLKSFEGRARLMELTCATDADDDLVKAAEAIKNITLPIILVDDIHRLSERAEGVFCTALSRILDDGMIAGSQAFRKAIVVMTVRLDESLVETLADFQEAGEPIEVRRLLKTTSAISVDLLNRADLALIMRPLKPAAQVKVAWKLFCRQTSAEMALTILNDRPGEGIYDFFSLVTDAWETTGEAGIFEAKRFIETKAQRALIEARTHRYQCVRAKWNKKAERLAFDPVITTTI
jgi:hypothetical protein